MSTTIDQRIVEMRFDNREFENNVQTSLGTLDKLKQSLDLSNAAKGLGSISTAAKNVSLAGLSGAVETVHEKFTALEVMAVTSLANITNSAVNAGKRIVSALTIDPIKTGFSEYETKINAIQTILTNTQSKGTTLNDVNEVLAELNEYADQTIYNFAEMTRNIGTFTAAGVDLDSAATAIKGIANLAAGSGSTSQQASTAMYQLSQALASGAVSLQDWNSVVNAGMGGEYFQKALKETAKQMGVVINESVSFRDSMNRKEGGDLWITSEILLETLKKFAEDETLVAAATQVKTFTQLFDTMGESVQSGWSVSWEHIVGNKEEATATLTAVNNAFSELIGPSTEARNTMLAFWHDNGGRDAIINAISNAFNGLKEIINPVTQALHEIFPAMDGEKLTDISKKIENLTEKFKISDTTADQIYRTFKGLFSVVDIGVSGVSALVDTFISFVKYVVPADTGILNFTASIGDYLVGVNETIKKNDTFNKAFQNLGTFLKPIADKVKGAIDMIVEAFRNVAKVDTSGLDSLSERMNVRFEPLKALGVALKTVMDGLYETTRKVAPTFFNLASAVGEALGNLSDTVANGLRNFNFDTTLDVVNSGLLAALVIGIKDFINSLGEVAEQGAGFFGGFKDIFDGIKGCLESYQKSLQADTLIKIASAIGILAVSLVALSLIDSAKLTSAVSAMSVMFAELVASMGIMNKISGGGTFGSIAKIATVMLTLSTSMVILSAAVANLSGMDWDDLVKGLSGVGVLCAELAVFLNNTNLDGISLGKGLGLMTLAQSIVIISDAVKTFGELNVESLVKGLGAMAAILAELAIFTKLTSDTKGMISTATGMTILGAAMLIFAEATERMGLLPMEVIGKGLLTMAVALAEVTLALNFMPTNMISTGVGLVAVASSLLILAQSLQSMGGMAWEEIAKSLVTLAGSLAVITVAINAMTGALAGAAAMLTVAAAIAVFTPALMALGSMSMGEIGTGLLALAGVFGVVGVAGLALAPLTPVILALSAAIALFGAGCIAVGAGVLAFSAGLTALAASGTAGAAALTVVVTTIIGLIPMLIKQLAEGVISFAVTIAEGAPKIAESLLEIARTMIAMVSEVTPDIVKAVFTLLTELLNTMLDYIPNIVDAGMKIIAGFLKGIADNIQSVIDQAVDVMVNFIEGIKSKVPDLVQAGFDLIIDFVNGLAEAIEKNTPTLVKAIGNLAGSMIDGLVDGLFAGIDSVVEAAKDVGRSIIDGVKDVLDINSPSKEMEYLGEYSTDGLNKGLNKGSRSVFATAAQLGTNILNGLNAEVTSGKFVDIASDICDSLSAGLNDNKARVLNTTNELLSGIIDTAIDTEPTIRPILDLSNVESKAGRLSSLFGRSQAMSISASMNRGSENIQNGVNPVGGNTYQFTQNNYSPKALSRVEIYRQTKNQFSAMERMVEA